jgi:hypothetical protein
MDTVGTRLVVGARHHRLEAVPGDRIGDSCRIGRHDDAAHSAFGGAAGDMDDHGLAGDIGQWLSGQPCRRHAGWNEDENRHEGDKIPLTRVPAKWQNVSLESALIGVATGKQKT